MEDVLKDMKLVWIVNNGLICLCTYMCLSCMYMYTYMYLHALICIYMIIIEPN